MILISMIVGIVLGHLTAQSYIHHNYIVMWLSIAAFVAWVVFLFADTYSKPSKSK